MIQLSGSTLFWQNEAVEAIVATEVVEDVEVIEAAVVLKPLENKY